MHSCEVSLKWETAENRQVMNACMHDCLVGLVDHCGLPKPPSKKMRGAAHASHKTHVRIHEIHQEHTKNPGAVPGIDYRDL
jgi:hypothetical protein